MSSRVKKSKNKEQKRSKIRFGLISLYRKTIYFVFLMTQKSEEFSLPNSRVDNNRANDTLFRFSEFLSALICGKVCNGL